MNKHFFLFLCIGFIALANYCPVLAHNGHNDPTCCSKRCTGSAYCTACKNCSACKHCNSGGSCGVCAGKKSKSSHYTNTRNNYYSSQRTTYTLPANLTLTQNVNLRERASSKAKVKVLIPRNTSITLEKKVGNWYYAHCVILGEYYDGYINRNAVE